MNKTKYTKIIVCCVVLIIGMWYGRCATVLYGAAEEGGTVDVGRSNPFAEIEVDKKALPQAVRRSQPVDENLPELFLETILVKSCDAKSLKSVVEKMVSAYGSISVDEQGNSLIVCDSAENLAKILAEIQKIDKKAGPRAPVSEKPSIPSLFVETVTLKFLDAKNLKLAIEKMSSIYGNVSVDGKTNSLIICDTKENLERILGEIKKADKTPPQIMIEVVILDVQLNNDTEIGINWDILSDKNYDLAYRQNFTTSRLGSTIEDAANIGKATAFNTTGSGGDFTIISGTIRNVVHLIQEKRDVEILASPRVMVVSGQSAFIEAIEELPYTELTGTAQGGAQALTSTEFKNVGVKLNVSATLIDSNDIFMTVEAEQNVEAGVSSREVPIIDTRKAKTSLLLRDGQVVVLGGLRRQEKTREVDQIPILGDLPIIGELFKSTNVVVKNSELIVFLAPHTYKGEPIPDKAMVKFNEINSRPQLSMPSEQGLLEGMAK